MATPVDQIVIVTPPETTPASSVGAGTRVFTIENDAWVHFDLGDAVGVFAPRAITIANPIGGITPIPSNWANTFVTDSTGTTYFVDASLGVHDITQRRIVVNPLHFDGDGSSGAPLEIADGAIAGDLVAAGGIGWGKLPTTTGASIVGRLEGTNGEIAPFPIDMVDSFVDDGGTLKTKLPDAPADGEQYSRQNGAWVPDRWLKTELATGAVTINSPFGLGITTDGNSHWRTSGVLTVGGQTGTNAVFDVASLKTTINGVNGVDVVTNGVVAIQTTNVQLGAIGAAIRQPAVPPSDWGAGKFPTWSDANTVTWADIPPQMPTPTVPADENKYVSVDAGGNYVLTNPPTAPSLAFTDLTDTPSDYLTHQNKLVAVNALGDALVFIDPPTGGGAQTFLELTDTPTGYGTAGQIAVVNATADGLEFATAPADKWLDTELPAGDVIIGANGNTFELNSAEFIVRPSGAVVGATADTFYVNITGGSDLLISDNLARINAATGTAIVAGDVVSVATDVWQKFAGDGTTLEYEMPSGVVPQTGQFLGAVGNGVLGFVPAPTQPEKWLKTELEGGRDVIVDAMSQVFQIDVDTATLFGATQSTLWSDVTALVDAPNVYIKANSWVRQSGAGANLYQFTNNAAPTDRAAALVVDGSNMLDFREIMVGGGNSNADPDTLWDTLSVNSMRPMGGTGNPTDHGGMVTFGGKYISGEMQFHWADGGQLNYRTRAWNGTIRGWWKIYTEQSGVPWSAVTGAPSFPDPSPFYEPTGGAIYPVNDGALLGRLGGLSFKSKSNPNRYGLFYGNAGDTVTAGAPSSDDLILTNRESNGNLYFATSGSAGGAGGETFQMGITPDGQIQIYRDLYIYPGGKFMLPTHQQESTFPTQSRGAVGFNLGADTAMIKDTNGWGHVMTTRSWKTDPDNYAVGRDAYWHYRFYNTQRVIGYTNTGSYYYLNNDLQLTPSSANIDSMLYMTTGATGNYAIMATDTGGTGRYEMRLVWEYGLEVNQSSVSSEYLGGFVVGFYDGSWWHISFLPPTGDVKKGNRHVAIYTGWAGSTKNTNTPWGLRVVPAWGRWQTRASAINIIAVNVYIRQVY